MTHEYYEDLVAAYAFDALDSGDRRAFEAHLPDCASCREAVADLRRVSAAVGLTTPPVAPPPELRERVLAAALSAAAPTGTQPAAAAPSRAREVRAASPAPAGWPWRAALAASLLLTCALGTYAWRLRGQVITLEGLLTQASNQSNQLRTELAAARAQSGRVTHLVSVIGAPDVKRVELHGQPGAPDSEGRAYISNTVGVIFSVHNLPALDPDKTYQLWLIPVGANPKPVDAGTFRLDPSGGATLNMPMPAGVPGAQGLAVSLEPSGGSPTGSPTTAPVLLGLAS